MAVLSTFIDFVRVPDDAGEGAAARLERQRVLTHGDRYFHMVLGSGVTMGIREGADDLR